MGHRKSTYTVKELAEISGVSVRTLHFYDEIGLFQPARVGENKYRYYEEAQLLILQQILFFRELGFELKEIQKMLAQDAFDKVQTLKEHRRVLLQTRARAQQLIQTIDRTIESLQEGKPMKGKELFKGFSPQKQAEYEKEIAQKYGADHPALLESRQNVKGWTPADWEKSGAEWNAILKALAGALNRGANASTAEVQKIVARHCAWLKQFWTPNRASYAGLGETYTAAEWSQAFEAHDPQHPRLAQFLAEAMKIYGKTHLK